MKALLIVLGIASTAQAGEIVTAPPTTYSLNTPTGTPVPGAKGFKTLKDCTDAAPVPAIKYRCVLGPVVFDKVGTCADVPKPETKLVLDAGGFLVLPKLKIEQQADGTWGPTMEQGYIAAEYPACWVPGLVPYTGKWHAPELPPTADAGPWIEGVDYILGRPCPEAAHGNCYPSPYMPKEPPAGCTSEFCVTG